MRATISLIEIKVLIHYRAENNAERLLWGTSTHGRSAYYILNTHTHTRTATNVVVASQTALRKDAISCGAPVGLCP